MSHSATRLVTAAASSDATRALDLVDLAAPADVSLLVADLRAEERGDDLRRELGADHTRTEAQHIESVVLDSLMRRVGVVDRRGTDPTDLARRDRHPGARAAHQDAALGLTGGDRATHLERLDRVVDRLGPVGAEVEHLMAAVANQSEQPRTEWKPGVVEPAGNPHFDT